MPPSKHAAAKGGTGGDTGLNVLKSYYLYAALLALKLIVMGPLASLTGNPVEGIQRANDLKNLTPFWLVAALYVTSGPDPATAISLLRTFVIARIVTAVGCVYKIPNCAIELAFFVTFGITCFMAASVVYTYRAAL